MDSSYASKSPRVRSRPAQNASLEDQVAELSMMHRQWMNRQEEEIGSLQHRVVEQQRLLLEREREILRLEQEKHELEMRRGVAGGDHEEPWAMDLPCTGQSTRRSRRRGSFGRLRFMECVQLLFIMVLLAHYWNSFSAIQSLGPTPATVGRTVPSSAVPSGRTPASTATFGTPISPFASTPPKASLLGQTESPAIMKRHVCIQKIRAQHVRQLGPYILNPKTAQQSILLVDPAYHKNVGDHMLTLGELELMKRLGYPTTADVQCSYLQADKYVQKCPIYLKMQVPTKVNKQAALWHAGGNWGDLWRTVHDIRVKESFGQILRAGYTFVGMPQSLYYKKDDVAASDTATIKKEIAGALGKEASYLDTEEGRKEAGARVVLTWREQASLEKAQQLYPFATNIAVPDIAFQLGPYEAKPPSDAALKVDVLLFMRKDLESVLASKRNKVVIRRLLDTTKGGEGLKFRIVDWVDRLDMFQSNDWFFTETSVQLLSIGRVVVCDRLHAAILCYLAGIPFVYVDQVTGKISKTLDIAFQSWEGCQDAETAMWARAQSLEDALTIAVSFLDKYKL